MTRLIGVTMKLLGYVSVSCKFQGEFFFLYFCFPYYAVNVNTNGMKSWFATYTISFFQDVVVSEKKKRIANDLFKKWTFLIEFFISLETELEVTIQCEIFFSFPLTRITAHKNWRKSSMVSMPFV